MTCAAPGGALGTVAPACSFDAALASFDVDRPTLVLDIERVAAQDCALKMGLGFAHVHHAMTANPTREILERPVGPGAHFDAAWRGEIELCPSQGAQPRQIAFGNTIRKPADIRFAHHAGITLFAADAEEELEKIVENAPGAEAHTRVPGRLGVQPQVRLPGGDPLPDHRAARLGRTGPLHPHQSFLRLGRRALRETPDPAAAQPPGG